MIKYIIPLGADCYSAITLDELNLRKISLPFDYIYSDIKMIKDCIENNFSNFLNLSNYKNFGRRGCINKFYKKKFPHFNMFDIEMKQKMMKRIEKFKNILKSKEKKLFVHIIGIYNKHYIAEIIDLLDKYSNNYELLFIWKKRSTITKIETIILNDNIKVFKICSQTKGFKKEFIDQIFSNYQIELDYSDIEIVSENNKTEIVSENNKTEIVSENNKTEIVSENNKTLVLYCYCELGRFPELRKENLNFFLNNGIIDSDKIDYYIIINGDKLSINIPQKKNIIVKFRDNVSFDFGAYSDIILNENITDYNKFIFLNDSIRGPYLLDWFPKYINWTDLFLNKLNDEVKLVGTTINYFKGNPHINSQLFCTDKIGLNILIEKGIISTEVLKKKPVYSRELKLSKIMLDMGYNISCMLEVYKNIDFRKVRGEKYKDNSNLNANFKGSRDPQYTKRFFGMNLNPFETIFFKSNRSIDNRTMNKYSDWILNGNKVKNPF